MRGSIYTYVKDNPWTHFDPEGLEPDKPLYKDPDKALVEGSKEINNYKPKPGEKGPWEVEYRSDIWRDPKTGLYGYTQPYGVQDPKTTKPEVSSRREKHKTYEGVTHNHPNHDPNFSYRGNAAGGGDGDMGVADSTGKPIAVTVNDSNGEVIKKYTPKEGVKDHPSLKRKGEVTKYNPTTGQFEKIPPPAPLSPDRPVIVGIERDNYIYQFQNGKEQSVPIKDADNFQKQFEKK